jgi:hypothetical protein
MLRNGIITLKQIHLNHNKQKNKRSLPFLIATDVFRLFALLL